MCTRTTCPRCGKPTFVGCGRHVDKVLRDVPVEQRCHCDSSGSAQQASKAGAAGDHNSSDQNSGGFFARLFGR